MTEDLIMQEVEGVREEVVARFEAAERHAADISAGCEQDRTVYAVPYWWAADS